MSMDNDPAHDMFQPVEWTSVKIEPAAMPHVGFWKNVFGKLLKNKGAVYGLSCLLVFIFMAIAGPFFNNFTYKEQHVSQQFLPPKVPVLEHIHWLRVDGIEHGIDQYARKNVEQDHWFGTDQFGRDQWTRIWEGTRVSLLIAFIAAVGDFFIGVVYGGVSGYLGGHTDQVMQRIIEMLVGIPHLIFIILLLMVLGSGMTSIIIALLMTGWVGMARIVRSQVLKLKSEEFVLASQLMGASRAKIIFRNLLPNIMPQVIVQMMFTIPGAIFFEAFLSFIGLGLAPPTASLGTLVNEGFDTLQIHPYLVIYPSVVISLLLISFHLLGDGLRDVLDPKTGSQR